MRLRTLVHIKKVSLRLRYLLVLLAFTNCAFLLEFFNPSPSNLQAQQSIINRNTLWITNTASYPLKNKPVTIPRSRLGTKIQQGTFPMITSQSGKVVPSQLIDGNRDGKWDELFFLADLDAKVTAVFQVSWQPINIQFAKQTNVHFGKRSAANLPVQSAISDTFYPNMLQKLTGFEPYQTDGPTWENDKVAFRHYFDGRNAKDLFGKRNSLMMPDSVGINTLGLVEDNYHVLKDWGRDILPVSNSVGIGGLGLYFDKIPHRIGVTAADSVHTVDATGLQVLAKGPIQSRIQIKYNNWKPNSGRNYQIQETPSIWPGMYAYQNIIKANQLKGDECWAIGLPKVACNKALQSLKIGNWIILYTHDAQTYNKEYVLGLAIIVPAASFIGYEKAPDTGNFTNSYFAKLKLNNDTPLTYYAVGGWELSDVSFKEEVNFQRYLIALTKNLDAVIRIKIQ